MLFTTALLKINKTLVDLVILKEIIADSVKVRVVFFFKNFDWKHIVIILCQNFMINSKLQIF